MIPGDRFFHDFIRCGCGWINYTYRSHGGEFGWLAVYILFEFHPNVWIYVFHLSSDHLSRSDVSSCVVRHEIGEGEVLSQGSGGRVTEICNPKYIAVYFDHNSRKCTHTVSLSGTLAVFEHCSKSRSNLDMPHISKQRVELETIDQCLILRRGVRVNLAS